MEFILNLILLLVGFVFLIKGADYFVDASSAVAKKLKVPSIVVGLTIVAVGTSLPEMAVSAVASAKGANGMSFSNVVGSNIFNILMVLGVTAMFINIPVKKSILKREMPFLGVITLATLFLAGDALWFGNVLGVDNLLKFKYSTETVGTVERIDGALLILLFIFFIIWTVRYALKERKSIVDESDTVDMSNIKCVLLIIGGIIAIIAGGEMVVSGAKHIATTFGMSDTLIGLTVVALGTSLPELVTSAVAARKGEADIAVGNVVGSNIANILLVLGVSAAISPVEVQMMSLIDLAISFIIALLIAVMAYTRKKITKPEGVILLLVYGCYMAYIIMRQYM